MFLEGFSREGALELGLNGEVRAATLAGVQCNGSDAWNACSPDRMPGFGTWLCSDSSSLLMQTPRGRRW